MPTSTDNIVYGGAPGLIYSAPPSNPISATKTTGTNPITGAAPSDFDSLLKMSNQLFPYSTSQRPPISTMPGDFTQTLEAINALNRSAQQQANSARIPNASGLEAQSSANIKSALGGIVPGDVAAKLQGRAAERGVASGMGVGPNANAAYLRALGLTSLDLTNRGQEWLNSAYQRNPAAPLFDPTALIMTPYQQEQARIARENADLQRAGLQSQYITHFMMTPAQQAELELRRQQMQNELGLGTRGLDLREQEIANQRANALTAAGVPRGDISGPNYRGYQSPVDWRSLIPNTPPSPGGGYGAGAGTTNNSNWSDWENEFWNGSPSSADYSSYGLNPSFDYLTNPFIGTYDNTTNDVLSDPFFNDYGGYGYEDFYGG